MEGDLPQAVLSTLAVVFVWGIGFGLIVGCGVPVARLLRVSMEVRVSTLFWLGLAPVIAWLFLIHSWIPLDSAWARFPIVAVGLTGFILITSSRRAAGLGFRPPSGVLEWLIPGGTFVFVCVLANLALGEPTNYDSFLYHFASLRYHSEFPAIEGLVNLYFPLGNQSATFPLASALDVWPFQGEGFRLVNGLLVSALAVEVCSRLSAAARNRKVGLGDAVLVIGTALFLFIPGAASASSTIASPGLDTGAAVLFLVGFAYFTDAVTRPSAQTFVPALIVLCASAAFRPLNLVFLAFAGPLLLILVFRKGQLRPALLTPAIAFGAVLLLTPAIHSTIISGYPFYPASFPSFGLPWAHPAIEVADTRMVITQVARGRLDDPINLTDSLGGTIGWFREWFGDLRDNGQLDRLALLGLVALGGFVAIVARRDRNGSLERLLVLLAPLLPVIGIWFILAPLIRFSFGPLAFLCATPIAIAVSRGHDFVELSGRWSREGAVRFRAGAALLLLGLALFVVAGSSLGDREGFPVLADGSGRMGSSPPRVVEVERETVEGGLDLARPTFRDWCGFALWCTPHPEMGLKMRGEDPEDGFERVEGTNEPRIP